MRGVVCLVHGHGEHSGRYGQISTHLNRYGFAVLAFDLRGHGRSDGARGHFDHYDLLMSDLSLLVREAERRHPNRPVFLYGHSMGGNLVVNFILRQEHCLRGGIVSAPLLKTASPSPLWKRLLGRAMVHVWPSLSFSSGIVKSNLSHDADVVRAYEEDPLIHDRLTPRFLEVLQAGEWAIEKAPKLAVPLLLMHGARDRITSIDASRLFASRAGPLCTLRVWDDLYHEIHNEDEREQIFSCVQDWLEVQCGSQDGRGR